MKNLKKLILLGVITIYFALILIIFTSNILKYDLPIKTYIIVSQSMSPKIKAGDLIVVMKTKIDNLSSGDIITYKLNEITVTHRIVKINNNNIVTKGDLNNVEDSTITEDKVIGKYIFKIPKLGFVYKYMKNPLISITINIVLLVLLMVIYRRDVKRSEK